jgi:hypothetical protein
MNRRWTIALQLAGLFAQIVIPTMPVTPEWKPFMAALVAFAQGAQALLAQHYNPDGTPATCAWRPKRQR